MASWNYKSQKFTNTPADRARLVQKLVKIPGIIVCLEATGIYHPMLEGEPFFSLICTISYKKEGGPGHATNCH
jgi:hypothetical protein